MSGVLCPQGGNLPTLTGSATVTVGTYAPTIYFTYYGFSFGAGSVTPTLWGSSGNTFRLLCWVDSPGSPGSEGVFFSVNGYAPNEGWTTHTIAGTTFNRADASYATNGDYTYWTWLTPSNPYGTTNGATKAVSWS